MSILNYAGYSRLFSTWAEIQVSTGVARPKMLTETLRRILSASTFSTTPVKEIERTIDDFDHFAIFVNDAGARALRRVLQFLDQALGPRYSRSVRACPLAPRKPVTRGGMSLTRCHVVSFISMRTRYSPGNTLRSDLCLLAALQFDHVLGGYQDFLELFHQPVFFRLFADFHRRRFSPSRE